MSHEESGIHPEVAIEPVEVLAERAPVPLDPVFEGDQRHAFHLGHHPADVVVVLGLDGSQGEAAVAGDDSGHTVQVRRGGRRVPEELGVVVGVGVDDPRCDDQTFGVELCRSTVVHRADGDDHPVLDSDVCPEAGRSGAVDDGAVSDHVVEHVAFPSCGQGRVLRPCARGWPTDRSREPCAVPISVSPQN